MKPVRRLLAGLLVTVLLAWAVGSTLNATVFDRRYVTAAADTSGLYAGLAQALPEALSVATGGVVPSSTLALLITPQAVQDRLESVISGTAQAWELGRRAPRLDLSDIAFQVRELGLPLPPAVAALLETSRVLTSPGFDQAAGVAAAASRLAGGVAPLAAGVLALLIFLVAGRHRWSNLAGAGLTAALVIGLIAGAVWFAPAVATASLSTSNWSGLAEPVRSYFTELARGIIARLAWWGGGLAGASVILLAGAPITGRLLKRRHSEPEPAGRERHPGR